MSLKIDNIVFTGNAGGACCYFSRGRWITRKTSSLTGKRVQQDPAFKGFRESSHRMKEASPIAASLYRLIPRAQKEYRLYRLLTGEALKMIKQGLNREVITKKLKQSYIDPL